MTRTQQTHYCSTVVNRFKEELGVKGKLATLSTPATKLGQDDIENAEKDGIFSSTCRKHIGGLMYLARGTRPDIAFSTAWLARYVTSWAKTHNNALLRIMKYLEAGGWLQMHIPHK